MNEGLFKDHKLSVMHSSFLRDPIIPNSLRGEGLPSDKSYSPWGSLNGKTYLRIRSKN